ncbi:MAG: PEP-CTERM sorting domain-containing protein [Sphingomicrobium sp.]
MATAALGFATPAAAGVTVTTTTGTPLAWQIFGIKSTGNPVYGSSPNNTNVPNVTFDANSMTNMDIVNGAAQVSDATPKTPSLYEVIVNPDLDFTAMKFAVQLTDAGSFTVYYLLAGGSCDANSPACYTTSGGTFTNTGQQDNSNYLISGGLFDGIMIVANNQTGSTSPDFIFHVKQLSYTPAVPEPGTWGLMMLGFAGVGVALRRSRKRKPALMQIA